MPPKRKLRLFAALRGITGSCGSWPQCSPAISSSLLWLAFPLCSLCLSYLSVGYRMPILNASYPFLNAPPGPGMAHSPT
jgi:hypothetical protein